MDDTENGVADAIEDGADQITDITLAAFCPNDGDADTENNVAYVVENDADQITDINLATFFANAGDVDNAVETVADQIANITLAPFFANATDADTENSAVADATDVDTETNFVDDVDETYINLTPFLGANETEITLNPFFGRNHLARHRFARARIPYGQIQGRLPRLIVMVDDFNLEDMVPMFLAHNIYVYRINIPLAEEVFMAYQTHEVLHHPTVELILINYDMWDDFEDALTMTAYISRLPRLITIPVFVLLSNIDDWLYFAPDDPRWQDHVYQLLEAGADRVIRQYPHEAAVATIIGLLGPCITESLTEYAAVLSPVTVIYNHFVASRRIEEQVKTYLLGFLQTG